MKKLLITLSSDQNRIRFMKFMTFIISIDVIIAVLMGTTDIFKK